MLFTTSHHRTKDDNTYISFCHGSMSNANCIVPMPVAVDCLMKWAEISVQQLPVRLTEVSFNMEVEMIFFPWEMIWEWFKSKSNLLCNGSRLSIHSCSRPLLNVSPSVLNFPSLCCWWMGAQAGNNCRLKAKSLSFAVQQLFSGLKSSEVCKEGCAMLFDLYLGDGGKN